MSAIHPTAIVHPDAVLGSDVTIGPYAVIEGPARIGDRCNIQAHAVISGFVEMGEENLIGYGAIVGAEPQDFSFKAGTLSRVRIGCRNKIREYVTIHRGSALESETRVGDDCYLMAGVHLAHNVKVENHVVIANNALLGGHVQVAERVFIGGASVFHQFVRVGRLAISQGNSGFSKDVLPFSVGAGVNRVVGLNTVGLRRAGLNSAQRAEIKTAFDLLFRSGLNVSQALAAAKDKTWSEEAKEFWEFASNAKKRGLAALPARTSWRSADEVSES